MSIAVKQGPENSHVLIKMPQRFEFKIHKEFRKAYEGNKGEGLQYILDMGATEYCDSSALGMLLQLHEHAGKSRRRVRLLNVNGNVRTILQIAKLEELFSLS